VSYPGTFAEKEVPTSDVARPERPLFDQARLAVAGFLARYSGPTRVSYTSDLRGWFAWCARHDLPLFSVRRGHLELWARTLEDDGLARATIGRRLSTVAGFYRFAVIDGIIEHSPAEFVRRPKIDTESTTVGLDRMELSAFIAQAAASDPVDHALACVLGLLGLRVSEACSINIEDVSSERGHWVVTVLGKGHKLAVIPLPPRVARALDLAAGERSSGPVLLTRAGTRKASVSHRTSLCTRKPAFGGQALGAAYGGRATWTVEPPRLKS
jgi:site-specific recombinase XerC